MELGRRCNDYKWAVECIDSIWEGDVVLRLGISRRGCIVSGHSKRCCDIWEGEVMYELYMGSRGGILFDRA